MWSAVDPARFEPKNMVVSRASTAGPESLAVEASSETTIGGAQASSVLAREDFQMWREPASRSVANQILSPSRETAGPDSEAGELSTETMVGDPQGSEAEARRETQMSGDPERSDMK